MKIAIIDDNAGNRNILKEKLSVNEDFFITIVAENGKDFLVQLRTIAEDKLPDVALMDLEMPEMDGVKGIAIASSFYPEIKFVVLTIFDDEDKIFRAIKAGACGYLLKDESAETIASMLRHMNETGVGPISPGIAHKILQMMGNTTSEEAIASKTISDNFDLTEREREILKLLVQGLLYKEIGSRLDISPNTAKKHVMNIYQKLHINSRAQAIYLMYDKGLL